MKFRDVGLLLRTIRHLRIVQITNRISRRLFPPNTSHSLPANIGYSESLQAIWCRSRWRTLRAWDGGKRFTFLNQSRTVSTVQDWLGQTIEDRLWVYNLHYLDDLQHVSIHTDEQLALMDRWVQNNAPGEGAGWEPYPLSLRIVNWIKSYLEGLPVHQTHLQSLYLQSRWLYERIEYHLQGNHLFANLKALIFAGYWFQGKEAEEWRAQGLALLQRELNEQFLEDGAHFEVSPMYHCILLEDLLDLCRLHEQHQFLRPYIQKAAVWLEHLIHPDGEIAFFNDAAMGVAPPPRHLLKEVDRQGLRGESDKSQCGMKVFPNSGYVSFTSENTRLIFDTGHIGPDYLPGHAHADCLSIEMSVRGQRLLVNQGTSVYGVSEKRLQERKTRAHNTIEVDHRDSSEVWHGFRVARRARPHRFQVDSENLQVCASHTGYCRLRPPLIHRRSICFREHQVQIKDELTYVPSFAIASWHFHPQIRVQRETSQNLSLALPDSTQVQLCVKGGEIVLEESWYSPEFGKTVPIVVARVVVAKKVMTTEIKW